MHSNVAIAHFLACYYQHMCGIVGVVSRKSPAALDVYECLQSLQHRGQDASGIVTHDTRFFHEKRGEGLVREVFSAEDMVALKGSAGLGHVRYRTAGSLSLDAAQPFFVNAPLGIYLVHNGNLTNTAELTAVVSQKSRYLRSNSDSEILLNVFADALAGAIRSVAISPHSVFAAVGVTMNQLRGAYACILLIDKVGLLAFRDPHGIRPLMLGSRGKGANRDFAFASEDAAFPAASFRPVRDVQPGEAVLIDLKGKLHSMQVRKGSLSPCIFEYIYLARPDSAMNGISVYKTHLRLGRLLGRQIRKAKVPLDVVIPIPDSARPEALEIAHKLGIPHREGLVKNRYIGRTFIMPDQKTRAVSVRRKLSVIPLEFKGKRVLLVDDSIVRGTTIRQIIAMCREAGAKKVYVASAAPPVRFQNVYGVDIPTRHELVAHGKSIEKIRKAIGADGLFYQTVPDMIEAARVGNRRITRFEDSVFTGDYVTDDVTPAYLRRLEKNNHHG